MIDGILLTKFDTIDDKVRTCTLVRVISSGISLCGILIQAKKNMQVGAALSMVYISGAPVMFVGCGQSYTDLKKLNVKSIVKTLLK